MTAKPDAQQAKRNPERAAESEVQERVKHGVGDAQAAVGEPIDDETGTDDGAR